eukprot:74877_1
MAQKFIDEIVVINQINDKNCSTKCQTALQRSENVSQQILNQIQDVELLHLQLHNLFVYHNKEIELIEESKQLNEYFHQELSEIKTALRRIQCQIQNITITPVRYQFYSGSNECVKCVKCNHIVYALEYDVIFQLDYAKVIHDSCFNCCECGELISENDDNCVYIAADGVQMYCGEACLGVVKVILKRQLNDSKQRKSEIKQDIKRNKKINVGLKREINRLDQNVASQKQMLEQATYKLQKNMRKLDDVVKQTGVKAEDLVYFVSNVSAILPSILNSRDKLNCLSSNMHATKKMIDRSFRDGGKIRVDDYISNSQEFKHSLTKFIEPMKDNGIIYMSQLQCD